MRDPVDIILKHEGGSLPTTEKDNQPVLCSDCFRDAGLKLDALQIGFDNPDACPNCRSKSGRKLDRHSIEELAYRFSVVGTIRRTRFGGAPIVQFNQHQPTSIDAPNWLKPDLKLFEKALDIGFFYYGPRLWMLGEVEPLKALHRPTQRNKVIDRVLTTYPSRLLQPGEPFYRIRKAPVHPTQFREYDSPPDDYLGTNRLDSRWLPVMYASQDLEVFVHECRVTVEDDLFVATLTPTKDLRLLDLTELLQEDGTEFESLDIAIHMLFLAGKHAYKLSRRIAIAARAHKFDGIIYPSYFSLVRTGAIPFSTAYGISVRRFPSFAPHAKSETIGNLGLFGRPIANGVAQVRCVNRLLLRRVDYGIHFGPVGY